METRNLPYRQYLRGYNNHDTFSFVKKSPDIPYYLPWMDPKAPVRASEYLLDDGGEKRRHDVFELATADFDCWCAVKSGEIKHIARHVPGFSQYITLDGRTDELKTAEEMDALRRGIACAIREECLGDIFLDSDRYERIDRSNAELPIGEASIPLRSAINSNDAEAAAYIIFRVWSNCWERMFALIERKTLTGYKHGNVDFAIADFSGDRTQVCRDVFTEWLSRILPPQVMSMICVTVGASCEEDKWADSACRIMLDADGKDQGQMIVLNGINHGVPTTIKLPDDWRSELTEWESALVDLFSKGQLPKYYRKMADILRRERLEGTKDYIVGKNNVGILADFKLLRLFTRFEISLEKVKDGNSYEDYQAANDYLTMIVDLLGKTYGICNADIHRLLSEAEEALVSKAERFKGTLEYWEYSDLFYIYFELKDSNASLSNRAFELLAAQSKARKDGEDVILMRVSEFAEDAKLLRALKFALAREFTAQNAGKLSYEDFVSFADMYVEAENVRDSCLAAQIEELLVSCPHIDHAEKQPLEIVEERQMTTVANRLAAGISEEYYNSKKGRLTLDQYKEGMYIRAEYANALSEDGVERLDELLCGQSSFADSSELPADLLREYGWSILWNRCVRNECARYQGQRNERLTDEEYRRWLARLSEKDIEPETWDDVSDMLVARIAPDECMGRIEQLFDRWDEYEDFEGKLIRSAWADIDRHGNLLKTEEYEWWLQTYERADRSGSSFTEYILERLSRTWLKEEVQLQITIEHRNYPLLAALVEREVKQIVNLSAEKYGKWIGIYKELKNNDSPQSGVKVCGDLLSRFANFETIALLYDEEIQDECFINAVKTLLGKQKVSQSTMPQSRFVQWLKYLERIAKQDEATAAEARDMLASQYRLRDDNGNMVFAYPIAESDDYGRNDAKLLVGLIRVAFDRELRAASGIIDLESFKQWIHRYCVVKRWDEDEVFADEIKEKLESKAVIGNEYILRYALDQGLEDLEKAILEKEKRAGFNYTQEDYIFRLRRYFENRNTDAYLELLTMSGKGDYGHWVEYFLAYCESEHLSSENRSNAYALLERLLPEAKLSRQTIERFEALLAENATLAEIVRTQQQNLIGIIKQGQAAGMTLRDLRELQNLADNRNNEILVELRRSMVKEMVAAMIGGIDYDSSGFPEMNPDLEGQIAEELRTGLSSQRIYAEALEKSVKLLKGIRVSEQGAEEMFGILLDACAGALCMPFLKAHTEGRNPATRARWSASIAKWLRRSPDKQPADTLDEVMRYVAPLNEQDFRQISEEMYVGIGELVRSSELTVSAETYREVCKRWGERTDFTNRIRLPLLNGNEALTNERREFIDAYLNESDPQPISESYAEIRSVLRIAQREKLSDFICNVKSWNGLSEALDTLPWATEKTMQECLDTDEMRALLGNLTENQIHNRTEENRAKGIKAACLIAMNAMMEEGDGIHVGLRKPLFNLWQERMRRCAEELFAECASLYSANSKDEMRSAMDTLHRMLDRADMDRMNPISPDTVDWCKGFASMVDEKREDASLIKQIQENRKDIRALSMFAERVYEVELSKRSVLDKAAQYALLTAAKAQTFDGAWEKYLRMVVHMPQGDIFVSDKEDEIIMNITYIYDFLPNIGDDLMTRESLANYCAEQKWFEARATKSKYDNRLRVILKNADAAKNTKRKGGLFGWFK